MPQRSRVRGDKSVRAILKQLGPAAQAEMADVMRGIGVDLLKAMQADAPEGKTGNLRRKLSFKLLIATLRLRVGLLTKARGSIQPFYARFVEDGRKAQVVTVTRRRDTGPYQMRVRAMAPRRFVYKRRTALRSELRGRLQNYWNNVLTGVAAGANDG